MLVSYLQYYELRKCCKSGDIILFDYIMKCHITTKLFTIEPNESFSGNVALVFQWKPVTCCFCMSSNKDVWLLSKSCAVLTFKL